MIRLVPIHYEMRINVWHLALYPIGYLTVATVSLTKALKIYRTPGLSLRTLPAGRANVQTWLPFEALRRVVANTDFN